MSHPNRDGFLNNGIKSGVFLTVNDKSMCVVSMTGDMFHDRWRPWTPYVPYTPVQPYNPQPTDRTGPFLLPPTGPTQEDFDNLKKEVELLKELLKRAKEYDEKNGEPDCEIEDKMKFLREVAKLVGVDLDDVIKPKQ